MTNDERKTLEIILKGLETVHRGRATMTHAKLTKTITLVKQVIEMNKLIDEKADCTPPFNPEFEAGALLGMIKAYARFTVDVGKIPLKQRQSTKSLATVKLMTSTFSSITNSIQKFVGQIKRDKFQRNL